MLSQIPPQSTCCRTIFPDSSKSCKALQLGTVLQLKENRVNFQSCNIFQKKADFYQPPPSQVGSLVKCLAVLKDHIRFYLLFIHLLLLRLHSLLDFQQLSKEQKKAKLPLLSASFLTLQKKVKRICNILQSMPKVLFTHHLSNMIEQHTYVSAVLHIHLLQIS